MDRYTYELVHKAVGTAKRISPPYCGPYALCEKAKILLNPVNCGTQEGCIKGFYQRILRIKHITYNADLPDEILRQVLWHEIGHAFLHSNERCFDTSFLNSRETKELQANLFAAEIQVDDDCVQEALMVGSTFERAARELDIPEEILDFKLRMMVYRGYRLPEVPTYTASTYLRGNKICSPY